ncbi:hypothetical protein, partial [Acetobacter tropicalis]
MHRFVGISGKEREGERLLSSSLVPYAFLTTGPEWGAQVRCEAPGAQPRTGRAADEHGEHLPLAAHAPGWWTFCPSVLLSFCPS